MAVRVRDAEYGPPMVLASSNPPGAPIVVLVVRVDPVSVYATGTLGVP
jgi:hypothetical protein